ncbi:hypothetical protein F4859DRAFT_516327 [Xylaria cf. heliscus]|nr:hypothetical protein F4859DRAFT_516327 [Xylaria cf. heliscus]
MGSMRSLHVLRAIHSHTISSPHPLRSSLIATTRLSLRPPPFNHARSADRGRRSYHWQTSLNTAIEGTQNLILDLHTFTGLPWFLAIPLVGFTVGAVFRLPFQVYTQQILRRRTELGPLLQAWNSRIQHDVARAGNPHINQMSEVQKRQEAILRRLYRKLGLQEWRLYTSLASFPVWLLAIDGVRRLCGGPRGLIGSLIAGPVEGTADPATTSFSLGDVADATADPALLSSASETARTAVVDPSLTLEGCLWFTDLTVADPYHILPLLLSLTLVYNLLPKSGEKLADWLRVARGRRPKTTQAAMLPGIDDKVPLRDRVRARVHVGMLMLAAVVLPATLDLPAALHLYWLASSMTNAGFARGLRVFMPVQSKLRKRCTGVELPLIRPRRGLGTG